jgi:hypothetical protein
MQKSQAHCPHPLHSSDSTRNLPTGRPHQASTRSRSLIPGTRASISSSRALKLRDLDERIVVPLNLEFVGGAKGLVELGTGSGFLFGEPAFKVHLVEVGEELDAPTADGVGGVVARNGNFVDVLGLKPTRLDVVDEPRGWE